MTNEQQSRPTARSGQKDPAASEPRDERVDRAIATPDIDVLIVGGGINGAGVFRDLAAQGLRTLLVDKYDFCSGASAAPSRMIHGGLRYLEYGEVKLVRESLRERDRLLANAPHYVAPLATTMPIFSWLRGAISAPVRFFTGSSGPPNRGAALVKLGLAAYDLFTVRSRRLPKHTFAMRRAALAARPSLTPELKCAATFWDAWISHPERLCLELILDAEQQSDQALALNYVDCAGLTADGSHVRLTNTLDGKSWCVRPKVVINATGAWLDFTNVALGRASHEIAGTKGSHVVLDNEELLEALAGEMVYFENSDGRICIVFPWHDKVLAGSTEIAVEDPDRAICEPPEREYIRDSLGFIFPDIKVTEEQIVSHFCGVRPLAASSPDAAGEASRDHHIDFRDRTDHRDFPIFAMVGGKWTTFRSFAEQTGDVVLENLGQRRLNTTEDVPIGGGDQFPVEETERAAWVAAAAARHGVGDKRTTQLLRRYGTRALAVLEYTSLGPDSPMETHSGFSRREIEFLVQFERVASLEDLVLRRTTLALLGELTAPLLEELCSIAGACLGWDQETQVAQTERATSTLAQRYGISLTPLRPSA